MATVRWNLAVSADTDQALRAFLASQGGGRKGDLSRFVEDAVRAHILELTAEQAKAANTEIDEADLRAMVEEALNCESGYSSAIADLRKGTSGTSKKARWASFREGSISSWKPTTPNFVPNWTRRGAGCLTMSDGRPPRSSLKIFSAAVVLSMAFCVCAVKTARMIA